MHRCKRLARSLPSNEGVRLLGFGTMIVSVGACQRFTL